MLFSLFNHIRSHHIFNQLNVLLNGALDVGLVLVRRTQQHFILLLPVAIVVFHMIHHGLLFHLLSSLSFYHRFLWINTIKETEFEAWNFFVYSLTVALQVDFAEILDLLGGLEASVDVLRFAQRQEGVRRQHFKAFAIDRTIFSIRRIALGRSSVKFFSDLSSVIKASLTGLGKEVVLILRIDANGMTPAPLLSVIEGRVGVPTLLTSVHKRLDAPAIRAAWILFHDLFDKSTILHILSVSLRRFILVGLERFLFLLLRRYLFFLTYHNTDWVPLQPWLVFNEWLTDLLHFLVLELILRQYEWRILDHFSE